MKRFFFIALTCLLPILSSAQVDKAQELYDQSVYFYRYYKNGQNKSDYPKSHKLRMQAAKAGHAQAQCDIGKRYYTGYKINGKQVIKKDYVKAAEWFQKSTEQENLDAQYYLAKMYRNGYGLTADKQKAFDMYQQLAERGHREAIIELASAYLYDKDFKQPEKGLKMWEKGAELGYAKCMFELAKLYEHNKEYKKAEEWFTRTVDSKDRKGLDKYDVDYAYYGRIRVRKELDKIEKTVDLRKQEEKTTIAIARIGSDVDKDIPVAQQTQDKTFALIIANESYDSAPSVPYAMNDATTFEMYCRQALGIPGDNIHILKNASYGQMKRGVTWAKDMMKAYGGEAQVIVYYAGHGIPDEKSKAGYLLPTDGNAMNPSTAYALEELYKALKEESARYVIVLLDACFSGTKREGSMLASARGVAIKVKPEEPNGNLVVFSAAQGDETAYTYDEQQHGLFTYYLLKKLKEANASLTLGELSDYVRKQVMQQSVKRNNKMQTPTIVASSALQNIWTNLKIK